MPDFTPVPLIKGDITFTADNPTSLWNALGRGFRKVSVDSEGPEPTDRAELSAPAEKPKRRRTSTPAVDETAPGLDVYPTDSEGPTE